MKEPLHGPGEPTGVERRQPSGGRARPLNVAYEYVVIAGADGEALQRYQMQAIRKALQWLVEHPDPDTP